MPPPKPAYDVDWIFSPTSNVHLATHRKWFTSYTAFPSDVITGYGAEPAIEALGIGQVQLSVKTHPKRTGAAYHKTLILHNVLYVPTAVCNIIGAPILDEHVFHTLGPRTAKLVHQTAGAIVGIFDTVVHSRLRLSGYSSTQTTLDRSGSVLIRAKWADAEMARWARYKAGEAKRKETAQKENPPLTELEKAWLNVRYKGEERFLLGHGLSIDKDEDRELGRRILRALMEAADIGAELNEKMEEMECEGDEKGGDDDGEEEETKKENGGDNRSHNHSRREMAGKPCLHAADRYFSAAELDCIKQTWIHAGQFLQSYGLNPSDHDDCKKGKDILKILMDQV